MKKSFKITKKNGIQCMDSATEIMLKFQEIFDKFKWRIHWKKTTKV